MHGLPDPRLDAYFVARAIEAAWAFSDDPDTHVGAVLVPYDFHLSKAVMVANRVPHWPGKKRPEEVRVRPHKYTYIEHAERMAIAEAARNGIATAGATLYMSWEPLPCNDCLRLLLAAGVKRLVGTDREFPSKTKWELDSVLEKWGIEGPCDPMNAVMKTTVIPVERLLQMGMITAERLRDR